MLKTKIFSSEEKTKAQTASKRKRKSITDRRVCNTNVTRLKVLSLILVLVYSVVFVIHSSIDLIPHNTCAPLAFFFTSFFFCLVSRTRIFVCVCVTF